MRVGYRNDRSKARPGYADTYSPPPRSRSYSSSFAFVASVFAPSASPEFNATNACRWKFSILLICERCAFTVFAGSAFSRLSFDAISSVASCRVCGVVSPPAVSAPIADSSPSPSAEATCDEALAGAVPAGVVGLGVGLRLGRGVAAASAIGTGISSAGGSSIIGRLSGTGAEARTIGALLTGKTTACAFLWRHPLNPSGSKSATPSRSFDTAPSRLSFRVIRAVVSTCTFYPISLLIGTIIPAVEFAAPTIFRPSPPEPTATGTLKVNVVPRSAAAGSAFDRTSIAPPCICRMR